MLESSDKYREADLSGNVFSTAFLWNCFCTTSVSIHRSVLNDVGYFRQNRSVPIAEDYDLWLRIAARHEVAFIPECLALYRIHEDNISTGKILMLSCCRVVLERATKEQPEAMASISQASIRKRFAGFDLQLAYWHRQLGNYQLSGSLYRQAEQGDPSLRFASLKGRCKNLAVQLTGFSGIQERMEREHFLRHQNAVDTSLSV